jgi:hypothetical protein
MEDPRLESQQTPGIFSSPKRPIELLRTIQSPIIMYRGSFPVVKGLERKVDHLPPFGAEVKNGWSFTYALPLCLHIVQILHNAAIQVYQTPQNDHSKIIRESEEWIDIFEKFPSVGFVRLLFTVVS